MFDVCPKGDDGGLYGNFSHLSGSTSVLAADEDGVAICRQERQAPCFLSPCALRTWFSLPGTVSPLANSCFQVLRLLESLNVLSFPKYGYMSLFKRLSVPISSLGSNRACPVPCLIPRPGTELGTQGMN